MNQARKTDGLLGRIARYAPYPHLAAAVLATSGCGSKTDTPFPVGSAGDGGSSTIGSFAGASLDGGAAGNSMTLQPSASGTRDVGGTSAIGTGGARSTSGGVTWSMGAIGNVAGTAAAGYRLEGAPLPFAPTAKGFGLNAVLAQGDPSLLQARVRAAGETAWAASSVSPEVRSRDIAQWRFDGLQPGRRYEYEIWVQDTDREQVLYSGSAVTQRNPGDPYVFALITDSHIGPDLTYPNQGDPETLRQVSSEAGEANPDFMLNLGDMLDFHLFGFNDPPPDGSYTRRAYLNYRTLLGDTLGHTSHFATIGNWEGEDGSYTVEELTRSRDQRLLYMPGPQPTTYPESGSPFEDYYAFTWGDALFIVLNVMSYTPTQHLLSSYPGLPDDWTLGETQFNWLSNTLANAQSKWKFLVIHHTVGGAAGDDINSAYGRGGGQAAYVGEQAKVHELMLKYGAQIFFYGHDHVFADMTVDGIHYTLPGNSGAIWMFSPAETGYSQSWLEFGWTRVAVSPDSVDVQFMTMGGELLYEYTLP